MSRNGTPFAEEKREELVEKQEVMKDAEGIELGAMRPSTFHGKAADENSPSMPIAGNSAWAAPIQDETIRPAAEEETTLPASRSPVTRPPPAPPADDLEIIDDAATPVAQPSTPFADPRLVRRSSSDDSPAVPITPASTTDASQFSIGAALNNGKSWDIASEVDHYDGNSKSNGTPRAPVFGRKSSVAPNLSQSPNTDPTEDETFSVDRLPSKRKLWEAGTCFLRDEEGQLVCFGDLFPRWEEGREGRVLRCNAAKEKEASIASRPAPKTVVFFIRHFWCGQCQDYTFASLSLLDQFAVAAAGIRVVIISNGSWKIIKAYKKLFKCPFSIYVDGPRRLYQLLGWVTCPNLGLNSVLMVVVV